MPHRPGGVSSPHTPGVREGYNSMSFDSFIEMLSKLLYALLALGLAVGGLAWIITSYRQPRIAVADWAATHNYTLVSCQYRTLRRGPFFRFGRHNQVPVFYIVVTDQDGHTYAGWAKYDYPRADWGAMTIEVRWDKPLAG